MEKVFKVSGMMCSHCEKRVEKAVSAVDGVSAVKADSKNGTCTVTFDNANESDIKKAITDAGYSAE